VQTPGRHRRSSLSRQTRQLGTQQDLPRPIPGRSEDRQMIEARQDLLHTPLNTRRRMLGAPCSRKTTPGQTCNRTAGPKPEADLRL
jgi:hypothetical protein